MTEREVQLTGGNVTPVVRVGNTVRRAVGPWTPAVHALLQHLEQVGFEGAPRVLGFDEKDREVLSYIEGFVPSGASPVPSYVWSDESLVEAAHLLRRYHEAVASFEVPRNAEWQPRPWTPPEGELICHNDAASWNTVFQGEKPVAFIDWDAAGPGPPILDLAHLAYSFVPMYHDDLCRAVGLDPPPNRVKRLRLLCEAYGLEDWSSLLPTMQRRAQAAYLEKKRLADSGHPTWGSMDEKGYLDGDLKALEFLRDHFDELMRFADDEV